MPQWPRHKPLTVVFMTDVHAGAAAFYGVALALGMIALIALVSGGSAVFIAWRVSRNGRRNLHEQQDRYWQQIVIQLKSEAEHGAKQREHAFEQLREQLGEQLSRLLSRQLEHDGGQPAKQRSSEVDQRDRESQLTARREVYLEAAAALTHLLTLIGRTATIELDDTALLTEFTMNQARLAKVHLLGAEGTVDAVMTYMNELVPAVIELLTRRVPLRLRKHAIERHVALMHASKLERERIEALMLQFDLEGMRESLRWQAADADHRLADQQYVLQQATIAQLRGEQLADQMDTGRRACKLAAQVARLLPAAMAAVRGEIEAPLDQRRYEQLWTVHIAKIDYTLKQGMERIGDTAAQMPPDTNA